MSEEPTGTATLHTEGENIMLKWLGTALCGLTLMTSTAAAQNEDAAEGKKPGELKTTLDKVSYGFGLNQGRRFAAQGIELDPALIAEGFKDAYSKAEPKINDADLDAAFAAFQKELQEKMQARFKAESEENLKAGKAFMAKNGERKEVVTLKSGLQYEVIKEGEGASPKLSDTVKTHYHGTLLDGTVFDSSVQRKQPAVFPVSGVIAGWTEALQKMKVGSKWKLYVPADLAYGERGSSGAIGPNETLTFEVELLEIVTRPDDKKDE